jgi:hypothetical protein
MPWTGDDLSRTQAHIEQARQYIATQESRIDELNREGRETGNAEELLRALRQTLTLLARHLLTIKADLES